MRGHRGGGRLDFICGLHAARAVYAGSGLLQCRSNQIWRCRRFRNGPRNFRAVCAARRPNAGGCHGCNRRRGARTRRRHGALRGWRVAGAGLRSATAATLRHSGGQRGPRGTAARHPRARGWRPGGTGNLVKNPAAALSRRDFRERSAGCAADRAFCDSRGPPDIAGR